MEQSQKKSISKQIRFVCLILDKAIEDIQQGISYYNSLQDGLGDEYYGEVDKAIAIIEKNPYFQVRYDEIRCLPLKKFPYMVHYSVNAEENAILIHGVINTNMNPEKSWI